MKNCLRLSNVQTGITLNLRESKMTIKPQYTYDNNGNQLDVFLTLNDWNIIAEDLHIEPEDWQKKLIDFRLQ